jgi:hypothetical protein
LEKELEFESCNSARSANIRTFLVKEEGTKTSTYANFGAFGLPDEFVFAKAHYSSPVISMNIITSFSNKGTRELTHVLVLFNFKNFAIDCSPITPLICTVGELEEFELELPHAMVAKGLQSAPLKTV